MSIHESNWVRTGGTTLMATLSVVNRAQLAVSVSSVYTLLAFPSTMLCNVLLSSPPHGLHFFDDAD